MEFGMLIVQILDNVITHHTYLSTYRHTGIVVFGKEYFYGGGMGIEFCNPVRTRTVCEPNRVKLYFSNTIGRHDCGPTR